MEGSLPNFNFFNVNSQIFQQNRKVYLSNCPETNIYNISNISLRVIRLKNYNLRKFLTGKFFFLLNISGVNEFK